jgi:23S rRNA-/tRNA-specific pseudouridylate synthase
VVHQTDHKTDEISLIEQIQVYLGDQANSLTFSPALAHRIDRETSGVILIAKTKLSLEHLTQQFKKRTIQKTYLALVHKNPDPKA